MSTPATHRSYSQINQLRSCGEQYRLERIEKKPQRPSVPAVAGRVIHEATELVDSMLYHDGLKPSSLLEEAALQHAAVVLTKEIEKNSEHYVPREWKRYGRATNEKPHGEDIEWFGKVGIPTSIRAYITWRLNTPGFELAGIPGFGPAIEVPFDYYVGSGDDTQQIRGYIDRVFTSNISGGFYPLDIKSGQKPKTDEQLGLYAAALHAGLGWQPTYGFYLYGLKTGVAKLTPPLDISHWTKEKLESVYLPATALIDQQIFIPHPGENCRHCSVSEWCQYFQSAI